MLAQVRAGRADRAPARRRRPRAGAVRGRPARPRRGDPAGGHPLAPPALLRLLRDSASEPAILAELLAAALNAVAILWRTSPGRRPSSSTSRSAGSRSCSGCRPAGTATSRTPPRPRRWRRSLRPRTRASGRRGRRLLRARALVGREGGADARPRDAQGARRRRLPPAARRARPGRRVRRRRHRRHDLDHVGRPCRRDRRPRAKARRVAARRRGVRRRRHGLPGVPLGVRRRRARRLARRQRAQVAARPPMDCSCIWTSRPEVFREAFSLVPEYLRTTDEETLSLSDYGPALGRRFRALKLWAVLRCYGRERPAGRHPRARAAGGALRGVGAGRAGLGGRRARGPSPSSASAATARTRRTRPCSSA